MSDLPKVFVNKIDKKMRNSLEEVKVNDNNIDLSNIITNDKYSFNHKYQIYLNNDVIEDYIIQIDNDKLLNIFNGWIFTKDIIKILEIKK